MVTHRLPLFRVSQVLKIIWNMTQGSEKGCLPTVEFHLLEKQGRFVGPGGHRLGSGQIAGVVELGLASSGL